MKLLQETLREIVRFSKEDEEEFACIVKSEIENRQSSEMKGQKTRLAACQKRLGELETLLCKIYEYNTLGKLSDKRYQILETQYAKEQETLEAEIDSLQKKVDEDEQEQKSTDKFIALVKKYQNFEELDTVMLNQFIYKIFVHERDYKGVAHSPQTVEIYFNFVGQIRDAGDQFAVIGRTDRPGRKGTAASKTARSLSPPESERLAGRLLPENQGGQESRHERQERNNPGRRSSKGCVLSSQPKISGNGAERRIRVNKLQHYIHDNRNGLDYVLTDNY